MRPIKFEKKPKESLEEEYDSWYRRFPQKWTVSDRDEFMVEILRKFVNPKTILDVGCGNGHTLKELGVAYPDAQLFGLDLSEEGLKLAKQNVPGVNTIKAYLLDHDPTDKYDLTICLGTAEHFEDLEVNLLHLKKITGKYCYFEVPHNLLYSPGKQNYRRLSRGSKQWEWHFPRDVWEKKLIDAGFNIFKEFTGENQTWEFIWLMT